MARKKVLQKKIGMNSRKGLYILKYNPNDKRKLHEYLESLSFKPSERWIVYPLVQEFDALWITKNQALWIVSNVKKNLKLDIELEYRIGYSES